MEQPKDTFTAREVGVLIESLRSEFRIVSEGLKLLMPLLDRMDNVEQRLARVEERLTSVEDVVRIAFPTINKRFERIETKLGPHLR